jgi:hypothetical protein
MIIHEGGEGSYDPCVETGRGSWVLMSKTTLEKLLASYDRAYPEYTDSPREAVIDGWHAAERARQRVAA